MRISRICVHLRHLRIAQPLQAATSSAIADVERAGYRVSKVQMQREALPA